MAHKALELLNPVLNRLHAFDTSPDDFTYLVSEETEPVKKLPIELSDLYQAVCIFAYKVREHSNRVSDCSRAYPEVMPNQARFQSYKQKIKDLQKAIHEFEIVRRYFWMKMRRHLLPIKCNHLVVVISHSGEYFVGSKYVVENLPTRRARRE